MVSKFFSEIHSFIVSTYGFNYHFFRRTSLYSAKLLQKYWTI